MLQYRVSISDDALANMCLAALEAYVLGNGKNRTGLETYGYIWGHSRSISEDARAIHISRLALSVSAKRREDSVLPHGAAMELKREFMEHWSPELELLGDFHSHPYPNLETVRDHRGYEFSEADHHSFCHDDQIWESPTPIMVVATICEIQKVHTSFATDMARQNVASFSIGRYRYWLNAAIGEQIGNRRTVTPNKHSPIFMDIHSRFVNFSA